MDNTRKDPPSSVLSPRMDQAHDKRKKMDAERTDDPGPGRDDRSELDIEIDQAQERD